MKFQHSVIINKPLELVIHYFMDPQYLSHYQEGFIRKEQVAGEPGQEGAIAKMYYNYGKDEMLITEHVEKNELPNSFQAYYHHKQMENTLKATFEKLNSETTKYTSQIEYLRIDWVMPKLISLVLPSVYKRPPLKWMTNFKTFVESQPIV